MVTPRADAVGAAAGRLCERCIAPWPSRQVALHEEKDHNRPEKREEPNQQELPYRLTDRTGARRGDAMTHIPGTPAGRDYDN